MMKTWTVERTHTFGTRWNVWARDDDGTEILVAQNVSEREAALTVLEWTPPKEDKS